MVEVSAAPMLLSGYGPPFWGAKRRWIRRSGRLRGARVSSVYVMDRAMRAEKSQDLVEGRNLKFRMKAQSFEPVFHGPGWIENLEADVVIVRPALQVPKHA